LAAAVAAGITATAAGQPPAAGAKPEAAADGKAAEPATAPVLSLRECLAIGRERQPNVRAAQASLAAAEAGYRALQNIHPWTTVLAPDLPVRREQAARGLAVARADVLKAEQENAYDVTRLYFSYVYARQQERTADNVIVQLEQYLTIARGLVDAGAPDVPASTVITIEAGISQAKALRVPAVTGQPLALAALKEAMGVEQSYEFTPKDTELPVLGGEVARDLVLSSALCRRPELTQAAAGVDAFRLEVAAQDARRFARTVPTLAAGADLHSRLIPQPVRNGEYRPGALSPEMPTTLVGRREDRVARAQQYSVRQDILLEKTQNLVSLEALNAFYNWQATSERQKLAKERFDRSNKLEEVSRAAVAANPKRLPEAVQNEALIAKWRADYLEAVFEHLKAVATLERVTAGAVRADFVCK
jgi:outer membrane protein TolC